MEFLLRESPVPYKPIYLDGLDGIFAVVDDIDYEWAVRHTWRPKWDRHGNKCYAVRTVDVGPDQNLNRKQVSFFLHKEVCYRTNGRPPTLNHIIGDHKNGFSLDCRRANMRWATASENRRNIGGWYARQMALSLGA